MKMITPVMLFCLFIFSNSSKENKFTASTPASPLVRNFLGISLNDSIDFIRWGLALNNNQYSLHCNYGIGKPNTNGFYNGGKIVDISGSFKKEKNNYLLQNGKQTLYLAELNSNLLHILNDDKTLMIGNGGWSYTLNNMSPVVSDQLNLTATKTPLKDSMIFEGRTPCHGLDFRPECIKLKWHITFYADANTNQPRTYHIKGTAYRKEGGKASTWEIINKEDGKILYQLNNEKGEPFMHLLKLDEGVLIFTDAKGNLLVGNLDFSYSLNKYP
jgi:hypothetical protein